MQISEGRVRLITENDLSKVLAWRNSERINKYMFSNHPISMEEHQRWFEGLNATNRICLIFELNARPVGVVNVTDLDSQDNKCSWGFYLGETDIPKGTGLLMGYHGLEFIFGKLSIRKLCSKSFVFNRHSIGYHKKLGFVEEGILSQECKKNEEFQDVVLLALFKDQWQKHRLDIEKILLEY